MNDMMDVDGESVIGLIKGLNEMMIYNWN